MTKLYVTTISSAKARDKDYKLGDGAGLYLLVRPNGSKLWRLNYSWLGKQKTMALGQWPELSLADARDKRDEARRLLALGVDPSHQQKVDAAKARIEDDNTFKAVAKEWIAKQEREEMAEITLNKIRWLLDKAYPKIGARPIAQVTAYELLLVLRSVEATGRYESARRMRSVLGRIFRYAVATTRAERDPTADLRGALTVPKPKHLAAIRTPSAPAILCEPSKAIPVMRSRSLPSGFPLICSFGQGSCAKRNGRSSISTARSGTFRPTK